jgi:tetratricopeptide (TPR) repeat protein
MKQPPLPQRATLDEGHSLLRAGRYPDAIRLAQQHLRSAPRSVEGLWILSTGLLAMGEGAEAASAAERAIRVAPGDARLHDALCRALSRAGRFPEARRAVDRARQLAPTEPTYVVTRAELHMSLGEHREALALLAPLGSEPGASTRVVSAFARACRHTGDLARAAEALERCLARPDHGPMVRLDMLFDLGEVYDALGDFDKAFAAFQEGHALRREPHEADEQSRAIDALIRAWTPAAISALPGAARSDRPLFIVGFWRSGTTLVEQTLSMHRDVAPGDELPFLRKWAFEHRDWGVPSAEPVLTDLSVLTKSVVDRASRDYLAVLRGISPGARRVTDKMPTNFVQLGLISVLFPGARVIHCSRGPEDTCLSCYFNLRGSLGYAHDLYSLGRFYSDSRRLMDHWRRVLDLSILEVSYEELVADHEGQGRRMVEFAGLPWDDACLRPHENPRVALTRSIDQVRRPVYGSSVSRWKKYEKHLGPLLAGLGHDAARDRDASHPA